MLRLRKVQNWERPKLKAYQADKAKFEANAENQLYKGDAESKDDAERIVVELNYTSMAK